MDSLVIIEAVLTCPPSMAGSVRCIQLYAAVFMGCTPLFAVPKEERDAYWNWLRHNYLLDFSHELVFIGDPVHARNLLCASSEAWAKWDSANWEHILEVDKIAPDNVSKITNLL